MSISKELRQKVIAAFHDSCAYCHSQQANLTVQLEIDHIIPSSKGGTDDEENLCLACRTCNTYKGAKTHAFDTLSASLVPLFNPRQQLWSEHFHWSADSLTIEGLTAIGRATVEALQLNKDLIIRVRRRWVAGNWHPPQWD